MASAVIRAASAADSARICAIYNHHVRHTIVTFEEEDVSQTEMARRIMDVSARLPWLVSVLDGEVVGYAYAAPWKARSAYRFSVESTVYLAEGVLGRGLGLALYQALLEDLRTRNLHLVIGGIALPNAASVALHEKLGFRKIAHFQEVGWKCGRWVDVGYWQLLL